MLQFRDSRICSVMLPSDKPSPSFIHCVNHRIRSQSRVSSGYHQVLRHGAMPAAMTRAAQVDNFARLTHTPASRRRCPGTVPCKSLKLNTSYIKILNLPFRLLKSPSGCGLDAQATSWQVPHSKPSARRPQPKSCRSPNFDGISFRGQMPPL